MRSAYLSEIFSSLQGEGIYQGVRQLFIRFAGCNLNCDYCDTPEAKIKSVKCKVSSTGGPASGGESENGEINNPLFTEKLIEIVKNFNQLTLHLTPYTSHGSHHSISLTGGEPLLQTSFLEEFIPEIKNSGWKIYLETNGTLPEKLERIIELIDFIAMDIKLFSATGRFLIPQHKHFLKISQGKKIFVKIVLTQKTEQDELWQAIQLLKSIDSEIPLVLQPVTPHNEIGLPGGEKILSWFALAKKNLSEVRIIPQKHKFWNRK